jgi:hypothetical protein
MSSLAPTIALPEDEELDLLADDRSETQSALDAAEQI